MRYLILFVLTVSAFAQTTVNGYLNLNLASPASPGTTITNTILNNGSTGSAISSWSISGTTANMTVGAHNPACSLAQSINVGGTLYGPSTTSQGFAMSMTSANTAATASISGSGRVAVISTCWKAPSGSPTNVQDIWSLELSTMGFETWIQWVPTNSLRIESAKDSFATSPGITLVPGTTYQVVILDDFLNGFSKLAVFNTTAPYAQVGTTQQMNEFINAGHLSRVSIGNQEIGTSSSTQQMENMLIDNTSNGATFPTLGVGAIASTLWSSILSSSRAIDWTSVGVVGGIPSATYTQCGATMTSSSTTAQIISRITGCGLNTYLQLGAGSFNLGDGVVISNKTNFALRGLGADLTSLVFSGATTSCGGAVCGIIVRATDGNFNNGPSNTASWTAGYSAGTTAITVSAHTNMKVGNYIILDQLDDDATRCDDGGLLIGDINTTCATAGIGSPTAPGVSAPYSGQGNGGGARANRSQQQIVQVASCGTSTPGAACTSNSITISPGLYMSNWASGKTPQAWWATSPSQFVGIENLSIDNTNNGQNANACSGGVGISVYNSPNVWITGVRDVLSVRAHVQILYSPHLTIRNNYFYGTQNRTSCSYGVEVFSSADSLIENNVFQGIASPYMSNGPDPGVVFGYNFSTFNLYTASSLFTANAHGDHDAGNGMALIEGNVGNVVNADTIHGSGNFQTYFRNRYSGQSICWQSSTDNSSTSQVIATGTFNNCTANTSPFVVNSFHRFYNLVGNIVGTTGANTGYNCTASSTTTLSCSSGTAYNFVLGEGNPNFSPAVPNDVNVSPTTMLWGNCDSATGFSSCRNNSSEVPSALSGVQAAFSNPVPANNTLPPSFYYASKPSWWPSGKVWPPIGPDVTGGNISGTGGRAYTIPAQDCYLNVMAGPANGVSSVLTFSAANCYGTPANPNPPPTAPATAIQAKFTKLLNPFLEAR